MTLSPDRFRAPLKPCVLGTGSFGTVTEALDLQTGHLIATKSVTATDDESIQKLIAEISLMKKLSHPNIVKYIGASRTDQQVKIYLEYIAGGSLARLMQKYGNLPESVVRMYMRDVVQGLHYLHSSRIAHRDIKCENLLLSCQGVVKLADFGTSKQADRTFTGTFTGTPWFMAPEVASGGSYDPILADIWSLGITLHQMIDGRPPFSDDPRFKNPIQFLVFICSSDVIPPPPANVSSECIDFLSRCLQRTPQLRSTAEQLLYHPFICGSLAGGDAPNLSASPPSMVVAPGGPGVSPRMSPRPPSAERVLTTGTMLTMSDPFKTQGRGSRPPSAEVVRGALRPHHLPSMFTDGTANPPAN